MYIRVEGILQPTNKTLWCIGNQTKTMSKLTQKVSNSNYDFTYTIKGKTKSFKCDVVADGDSIYLRFDDDFYKQSAVLKNPIHIGYHFRFDVIGDWKTETSKYREEYLEYCLGSLLVPETDNWFSDYNGISKIESYIHRNPNDKFTAVETFSTK